MREGGRKAPIQGHEEYASLEAIWRDFGKCDAIYDLGEIKALRRLQKAGAGKCTGECVDVKPRRALRLPVAPCCGVHYLYIISCGAKGLLRRCEIIIQLV